MNLRAKSEFRLAPFARLEAILVPRLIAAVEEACDVVAGEARAIVPVDTGELQASIGTEVLWQGQQVNGAVLATSPHAAYVEFGTGQRGAASPGAGPWEYNPNWPGMPAQPYLRPALDTARPAILEAFRSRGFAV